jgi:tRNA(adenine34) deaminase
MQLALEEARQAGLRGEVPVGAVLVKGGEVIASGSNAVIGLHDPTAHAEVVALRAGASTLQNYRLPDCELFVTLEPCAMCAGAMIHSRIKRVVFGASDLKTGAAGGLLNVFSTTFNHQTTVQGGVLAEECGALLKDFFKAKRERVKA